jgi:hypothetical protein
VKTIEYRIEDDAVESIQRVSPLLTLCHFFYIVLLRNKLNGSNGLFRHQEKAFPHQPESGRYKCHVLISI